MDMVIRGFEPKTPVLSVTLSFFYLFFLSFIDQHTFCKKNSHHNEYHINTYGLTFYNKIMLKDKQ
jgi:hypothetical protein